jgi:hypothetical protein
MLFNSRVSRSAWLIGWLRFSASSDSGARDLQPQADLVVLEGLLAQRAGAAIAHCSQANDSNGDIRPFGHGACDDLVGIRPGESIRKSVEYALEIIVGEVIDAALVEQRDGCTAAPGGHDLVAHRVVEQLAAADLIPDRAFEVQALLTLLLGEPPVALLDSSKHVERHAARLPEPELPLEHVSLLRGLSVASRSASAKRWASRLALAMPVLRTWATATQTTLPMTPMPASAPGPAHRMVCTTRNAEPIHAKVCLRLVEVMVMRVPTAATYQVP